MSATSTPSTSFRQHSRTSSDVRRPARRWFLLTALWLAAASICPGQPRDLSPLPGERHLSNLRQLTSGGQNAEAYFSFDGQKLVFQSKRDTFQCDQIYTMNLDGSGVRLVSTGKGRTTCSFFLPDGAHLLYASTHFADDQCPPAPDRSKGYVWKLYPGYDIVEADTGGRVIRRLTDSQGYDAEAVVSPRGDRIAFTSLRSGDLEIYTMKLDGSDVRQLTHELGYDGGPFFSPDGKFIVYRSYHPETPGDTAEYLDLLAEQKIRPMNLQIWIMDADGSHKVQLTHNSAANFAPSFCPDGKQIIFASNIADTSRVPMDFDLYVVNLDGTGLERVTYSSGFDGFPMFSPDGKTLVFVSSRGSTSLYETNIFVADWRE